MRLPALGTNLWTASQMAMVGNASPLCLSMRPTPGEFVEGWIFVGFLGLSWFVARFV